MISRLLLGSVWMFPLFNAGSAYGKQPEISLAQIVRASDAVFIGRIQTGVSASSSVGKFVKQEVQVSKVFKGTVVAPGRSFVCYLDNDDDPPILNEAATYLVFGKLTENGCYEPINGIRGVARVQENYVDTRYLKREAQSTSLNQVMERIKSNVGSK